MDRVTEIFGSLVFNDSVMKLKLPKDTYKNLKTCIENGTPLTLETANVVAAAMKDWAIERGATHYTHWFQPMTGFTAEKHDSFISPIDNGKAVMEFSGKELIKGESDASSFPSGGLRATFEARGYTAWDPTSYAFIKDGSLCIPTVFCSYGGEALDKKTPLMRSCELISTQAMRILRLFGNTTSNRVITTVGAEQEYFLIDKKLFDKREDLIFTGRTLFGAKPPKGQELDDHYFGAIKPRVSAYMKELDEELWKLGIYSKTKHNEVAPAQHEMAPIYTTTNTSADHNQLTMEIMKKVALKHGLVCLLHEKPFQGVNGSGKHNNWSLCTDDGQVLLKPGKHPHENTQFLVFLCAVMKAVDEYQDMLRLSVASAGNDHRLGGNEAPPWIVSMYIGDQLEGVIDALDADTEYNQGEKVKMETGVHSLPTFTKDTSDRNRTSPFAFTGNKFEFRMLGSSFSIAGPNIILNTVVADQLNQFADELEKAENFEKAVHDLIRRVIKNHKRIIFNGNNYSEEWIAEAGKRGLLNLPSTPDALKNYTAKKNIDVFTKYGIFTENEMRAREEILYEEYSKTVNVEGNTIVEMINKKIIPSVLKYVSTLTETAISKKSLISSINTGIEENLILKLTDLNQTLSAQCNELKASLENAPKFDMAKQCADYYKINVWDKMNEMRKVIDEIEAIMPSEFWPYPTYSQLLFNI